MKVNKLIYYSDYKKKGDTGVYFLSNEPDNFKDNYIEEMRQHLYKNDGFSGKLLEIEYFKLARDHNPNRVILVGMGNKKMLSSDELREAVTKIIKKAKILKSKNIDFNIPKIENEEKLKKIIRIISEKSVLSNYEFSKYKKNKEHSISETRIVLENRISKELNESVKEGYILGESNILSRNLVNEPANILDPQELSKKVEYLGKQYGFEVEVLNEKQIESLNMNAYLSVAEGSTKPPRFIVMKYLKNKQQKNRTIGLVGKGVTYDSGGLSIKESDSMLNSKYDMAGAAAVIGTMTAISKMNLRVNVVAVVAACESMLSGNSYKPGDIVYTMSGKSVYIENTDAEGRLTLADAIHYIIEKEKVDKIIDIATLTGAVIKILGNAATGVVSNNDEFYKELENASRESGEKIWRLPIFEDYRKALEANDADITNRSGNPTTITAAMFIEEFVQDKAWIHMDIAGTALYTKNSKLGKGSTGVGVTILYHLIKEFSSDLLK